MQKLYIILLSLILSLGTFQRTYANTDHPIGGLSSYTCDPVTGIGTLKLVFGSTWHHLDTRFYTLNNEGWYSLTNANTNYSFANIPWTYISGCAKACSIGPIAGISNHWPVNWRHDVMPWPSAPGVNGPPPAPYIYSLGNESHPDAYVHSGHWPNWVQAQSGDYNAAMWLGDWEWETGSDGETSAVGYARTMIQFNPKNNGIGQCAKCSTTIDPGTLYSSPVTPKCDQGTVTGVASTVVNGITNYTWSCTSGGGTVASCSAQYKPIGIPDPTDGQCDEYRLPRQCSYGVATVDKTQETSTGPLLISLINQLPISTSPYAAGDCRPPVDGKPRVVCDADPFITISSTLTSFTLPSSVTQKQGNCRVIFDSADTCASREDVITFTGIPTKCDPLSDHPECMTTDEKKVCIQLKDKFGNIVSKDANQVTITSDIAKNSYIESDTTQYSLGEVAIVDGKYCAPVVCTANCGTSGSTIETTNTPPGTFNLDNLLIGIGNPGGNFSYTPADMATHPSGGIIIKKKSCTGHLEVLDGEVWNRDGVMYDTEQLYRVVVDGTNPACIGGTLVLVGSGITGTGGVLEPTTISSLSSTGTFTAKIMRPLDAVTTERHPRGVYVSLMYTEPSGGIRYGLTASDSDFTDSPLLITGDRMKGVRVLGNTLGSNMSIFNHNNGNAIAEQTALVTESRNAMIKNINLLTRGMTDARLPGGRTINGILYVEGDIRYSSIESLNFQTLVVKGGDLTIDRDMDTAKGIVVIRGDKTDKGNIIITDAVRSLYTSIFSEGTFRGESTTAANPNPKIQLVLKGSLFSRNTIGGSADPTSLYTSGNASTTDRDAAFVQDLNHVRSDAGGLKYKGYGDPFIIDYDNMQGSPLPGFSN